MGARAVVKTGFERDAAVRRPAPDGDGTGVVVDFTLERNVQRLRFPPDTTVPHRPGEKASGRRVPVFGRETTVFDAIATGNPLSYILPPRGDAALHAIIGRRSSVGVRFEL